MKTLLLMATFICGCYTLYAQSALRYNITSPTFSQAVDTTFSNISSTTPMDTSEGGTLNSFSRWVQFNSNRMAYNAPTGEDMLAPAAKLLATYMLNRSEYCTSTSAFTGKWQCVGPFNNYYGTGIKEAQGRVNCIWVDPLDTSKIIIGSDGGGVWKSTNGGHSWHNITDNTGSNGAAIPGTIGVSDLAVDSFNNNYIYIAFGQGETDHYGWAYGLGLAYSKDGGQSW